MCYSVGENGCPVAGIEFQEAGVERGEIKGPTKDSVNWTIQIG